MDKILLRSSFFIKMEPQQLSVCKTVAVVKDEDKYFVEFKSDDCPKAFRLNGVQFSTLTFYYPEFSRAMKDFSDKTNECRYLSDNIWGKVVFPFKILDVREYELNKDKFRYPTLDGFTLNFDEFQSLMKVTMQILNSCEEFQHSEPFVCHNSHFSQIDLYSCQVHNTEV